MNILMYGVQVKKHVNK